MSSLSTTPIASHHTAIVSTSKGHFDAIQATTDQSCLCIVVPIDVYINDLGYMSTFPATLGVTASGTVVRVGAGIEAEDLKVGIESVIAYTFGGSEARGMQEYTLPPRWLTAKMPDSLSLEAAATVPNNFITAFNAFFNTEYLGLPIPSSLPSPVSPPLADSPILVHGGGSSTGHYAIQILHSAGYRNVLVTASPKHHEYLHSLGATHVFDYNSPTMVQDIQRVISGSGSGKLDLVLDCISAEKMVSPFGVVAILLPLKMGSNLQSNESEGLFLDIPEELNPLPKGTRLVGVRNFISLQQNAYFKENLMQKILPAVLEAGSIQPNRVRLLDESVGSLKDRVAFGLDLLRKNKVSREKLIVKVA
ncbi:NAD(P)-binding protein [Gymnopus androsaceus JB14]|uniref:NAD(P)-binding protein n=1 Tax=Gymnopus androsaceus JB14 TaxID=1447944 RepID=A0A6A4HRB8_9AGAR|nr:NAD(P)-binding protein [Gymnopus androsaceus JB14]